MKSVRMILAALIALLLFSVSLPLWAQTGTAVLNWLPPTACADNSPLTNCPITGYRVEKQNGATWATIATLGNVLTYTDTGLAAGTHTYRAFARSANGDSVASNTTTRTIAAPPPGPPVLSVVQVVSGVDVSPAYRILLSGARSTPVAGFVTAGTECSGPAVFSYRGRSYHRVAPSDVKWWQTTATENVAAPCS